MHYASFFNAPCDNFCSMFLAMQIHAVKDTDGHIKQQWTFYNTFWVTYFSDFFSRHQFLWDSVGQVYSACKIVKFDFGFIFLPGSLLCVRILYRRVQNAMKSREELSSRANDGETLIKRFFARSLYLFLPPCYLFWVLWLNVRDLVDVKVPFGQGTLVPICRTVE